MSFIQYTANMDAWKKYFIDQAIRCNIWQQHNPAYPISGGISAVNDTLQLHRIGSTSAAAAHVSTDNKTAEIRLTSSAQSSVQQARTELRSLKEEVISIPTARKDRKRKIVSRKTKEIKKNPRKSFKKARDIFSHK